MQFGSSFKNEFYHQGGLVDVNIDQSKIKKMIVDYESIFEELTIAHIEKITNSN